MGSSVSLIMQLNLEKVQRSEHGRKESPFFSSFFSHRSKRGRMCAIG